MLLNVSVLIFDKLFLNFLSFIIFLSVDIKGKVDLTFILNTKTLGMKKIFIAITLMFSIVSSYCQSSVIDSLEKLILIQKDTQLAATYNELTWQYRNVDKGKAILYGNKAIELAQKINYPKSIAQAYNDLGIIYFDKENYDTAITLYNKAIQIRKQLNDDLGIAKLYNKIGIVYQKQGVFDKGLENQFAALNLFEKCKNDFGISYSLNNIGILNQNLGRYNEAIAYHKKSLAIKQNINDKTGVASSFVNIANIYSVKAGYRSRRQISNDRIPTVSFHKLSTHSLYIVEVELQRHNAVMHNMSRCYGFISYRYSSESLLFCSWS